LPEYPVPFRVMPFSSAAMRPVLLLFNGDASCGS